MGKSGSGKSTILNLLAGLDKPTKGQVLFNGKDINKKSKKDKCKFLNKIGFVFQHFNLIDNLTVYENIVLAYKIKICHDHLADITAKELLKTFDIFNLKDQKVETLSGGEKARVGLCRALITSPEVVFADEPTGALDSNNGDLVFQYLKGVAVNKLVIVVTHNIEAAEKYAETIIKIENKNIIESRNKPSIDNNNKLEKTANIKRNFWQKTVILKNLKKHKIKNCLVVVSESVAFLILLISFGFINGNKQSLEQYQKQSLRYGSASISLKEITEIPNSKIVLSRISRPSFVETKEYLKNISGSHVVNSYESLFASYPSFTYKGEEISDINFSPIFCNYASYSNLLDDGSFPSKNNEVIVNKEFLNHFSISSNQIINNKIHVNYKSEFTLKTGSTPNSVKDAFLISDDFTIVGVANEFSYLNEPRVYYLYSFIEEKANLTIAENYSNCIKKKTSFKELVDIADGNDYISSYEYLVYLDDLNNTDKLYSLIDNNDEYSLTSDYYITSSSFSSLISTFSESTIVFSIIALIGTVIISCSIAFSIFIESKKESAILSILGAEQKSIFSIYFIEAAILAIIATLIAMILSIPLSALCNQLLYNSFGLINSIVIPYTSYLNIRFLLPIALIGMSLICAFVSVAIPFLFYKSKPIYSELKDE